MCGYFLISTVSARVKVTWEDKHYNDKYPSFILLCLSFYCQAQHDMEWDTPLVSWGQLSLLCLLLKVLCTPSLTGDRVGKGESLVGCKHGSATVWCLNSRL